MPPWLEEELEPEEMPELNEDPPDTELPEPDIPLEEDPPALPELDELLEEPLLPEPLPEEEAPVPAAVPDELALPPGEVNEPLLALVVGLAVESAGGAVADGEPELAAAAPAGFEAAPAGADLW
ncbi:hypothetical protein SAMN02799630_05980 [Paenibacillus sp. UNCCL117]|nr:hypothetical protein SAMN04488602_13712 [Paenibacillus sp. cl123]SFW70161.1 hypothetical protein SAMN02799630_05980 [Paenibacillus sp. UNCCL117]